MQCKLIKFCNVTERAEKVLVRQGEKVIKHPDYKSKFSTISDAALIKLDSKVDVS